MTAPNRLERRAEMLAQRMTGTSRSLAYQLGAGERPAFTTATAKSEALAWWRQHIADDVGRQALERLQPDQIMQLHLDLQQHINGEQPQPPQAGATPWPS